jgi:hypothetical protein
MGWRDLLNTSDKRVLPWAGTPSLRVREQVWQISGPSPPEAGWWSWVCLGNRRAMWDVGAERSDADPSVLGFVVRGYVVGDRLVVDGATVDPDPLKIAEQAETVKLLDGDLPRFARVSAGRLYEDGPLFYRGIEFPLGPEDDVLSAFLEGTDLAIVKGVTPPLDAAFRMEVFQRQEARKRRVEAEKRRLEEEARLQKEEQRKQLLEQLGDGAGRRRMAVHDFAEAARAALAMGNGKYLDHRKSIHKDEYVVTFGLIGRRFECTCDGRLQVIDSGICLRAEYEQDGFEEGTRGDSFFSLESLPGVIQEAERLGKLVVFRHVD